MRLWSLAYVHTFLDPCIISSWRSYTRLSKDQDVVCFNTITPNIINPHYSNGVRFLDYLAMNVFFFLQKLWMPIFCLMLLHISDWEKSFLGLHFSLRGQLSSHFICQPCRLLAFWKEVSGL